MTCHPMGLFANQKQWHMRGAAYKSAAAPVLQNAADDAKPNDVCCTKLNLFYQTDSDAAILQELIS